jgi:hypothetical protein
MEVSEDGCTLVRVDPAEIALDGHFKIPDTVTHIGKVAFSGCKGLTQVTFPQGLTRIGRLAFSGCENLTQATFPQGLTEIALGAFSGCTGLTEITFSESVPLIRMLAFNGCAGLKQVIFPEGLIRIGMMAFESCTNVSDIMIDTQNLAEFNRIKALLPQELRSKVIEMRIYNQVKTSRHEALEDVCRAPAISPLLGAIPFFRATDEHCKLPLINNSNIFFNINQYVGRDSALYALAEDEMLALTLPHDELQLDAYKNNLASIVAQYKPRKKKPGTLGQATEAESDISNEEGRNIRQCL